MIVVPAVSGHPYVVLAASTALSAGLTPVVIAGAHRLGWLAYPRSDRWSTRTVALMGGIAIVVTMLSMLLLGGAFTSSPIAPALAAGLVALAILGAVDDRTGVNPGPKLLLELTVAAGLILVGVRFGPSLPMALSVPLTLFWIIGVTNAMNLLDNMDGLAAGIGVVIGAVCGGVSVRLGDIPTAVMAFGLAGACLGYLPYNYRRARVFMGDTGSLPLGLAVATLSLLVGARAQAATGAAFWGVAVPLLLCAIPIIDTTLVTISRLRSGRRVSQGGRDHCSHRLVYTGRSDTGAVATLQAVALVLGLTTVIGTAWPSVALTLTIVGLGTCAGLLVWLLRIDPYAAAARIAAAQAPIIGHIQPAAVRSVVEGPVPESVDPLTQRPVLVYRVN